MDDSEHFRLLLWRTLIPLFALPVLGGFFAASPVVDGWGWRGWTIAGAVVDVAVAIYLLRAWLRSDVILDDRGLTLYATSGLQTWPYEKLLKIKQTGKYRVRIDKALSGVINGGGPDFLFQTFNGNIYIRKADCFGEEFCGQLIAERARTVIDRKGYSKKEWFKPPGTRNEAHDLAIYVDAVHRHLNINHAGRLELMSAGKKSSLGDLARKINRDGDGAPV